MNKTFNTNRASLSTTKPRSEHWFISISVSVTLALSTAASTLSKLPEVNRFQEKLGIIEKDMPIEVISTDLLNKYYQLNNFDQRIFLETFISIRSPSQIAQILTNLFKRKDKIFASPLAILLAEKAIARYRSNYLRFLVFSEYVKGVSVDRNFRKSREILDLPEIQKDIFVDYYEGIWWSDKSNPEYNLVQAEYYLTKAENNGLSAASKLLAKLRAPVN